MILIENVSFEFFIDYLWIDDGDGIPDADEGQFFFIIDFWVDIYAK